MNGKPPHDILLENLIDSVRDLTDARLQRRLWLVRGGPEVSSFVEMWCQTMRADLSEFLRDSDRLRDALAGRGRV